MELIPNVKKELLNKPEIEQVVKTKMESTLLGTYLIRRGLTLYSYNPTTDEIKAVKLKRGAFIQIEKTSEGWIYFDPENYQAQIDSKLYYFQALKFESAVGRVNKFKAGKIKELFNLTKPNTEGIDFFKPL